MTNSQFLLQIYVQNAKKEARWHFSPWNLMNIFNIIKIMTSSINHWARHRQNCAKIIFYCDLHGVNFQWEEFFILKCRTSFILWSLDHFIASAIIIIITSSSSSSSSIHAINALASTKRKLCKLFNIFNVFLPSSDFVLACIFYIKIIVQERLHIFSLK